MTTLHEVCSGSVGYSVTHVCRLPLTSGTVLLCAGSSRVSAVYEDKLLLPQTITSQINTTGSLWAALDDTVITEQQSECSEAAFATQSGELARAMKVLCNVAARTESLKTSVPTSLDVPEVSHVLLQTGEVTCMTAQVLNSNNSSTALAFVGTTAGTLCAFLINGFTLSLLRQATLQEWAGATNVVSDDVIVDVALSNDPAGRLEFIAAATMTCVIILDMHTFLTPRTVSHYAVPLHEISHDSHCARLALSLSFPDRELIRILAPQRLHAAAALSLACILVFSDGTVRFVRRDVPSGALHALREATKAAAGRANYYNIHAEAEKDCSDSGLEMPAVVYRYKLDALILPTSPPLSRVEVNDAVLVENAAMSCLDLVLVGLRRDSTMNSSSSSESGYGWWAVARGLIPMEYTLLGDSNDDAVMNGIRHVEMLHALPSNNGAALRTASGQTSETHRLRNASEAGLVAIRVLSTSHTTMNTNSSDSNKRNGTTSPLVILAADGTLYTTSLPTPPTRVNAEAALRTQLPALQRVTLSAHDAFSTTTVQGLSELYVKGAQCVVLCASGPLLHRIAL